MEHSCHQLSNTTPLSQLVSGALSQLKQLGYSRRSVSRHRAIWRQLTEFAQQQQQGGEFSEALATRFLDAYRIADAVRVESQERWRRHIAFSLKILSDFASHGYLERYMTDRQKLQVPAAMTKALRDYEQYCRATLHLRPSSLDQRLRAITVFLDYLGSRHIETLDQLQGADLADFVASRHRFRPKTVARILSDVRLFLRFLTLRGIVQKDLSGELPKIRLARQATIPSV